MFSNVNNLNRKKMTINPDQFYDYVNTENRILVMRANGSFLEGVSENSYGITVYSAMPLFTSISGISPSGAYDYREIGCSARSQVIEDVSKCLLTS